MITSTYQLQVRSFAVRTEHGDQFGDRRDSEGGPASADDEKGPSEPAYPTAFRLTTIVRLKVIHLPHRRSLSSSSSSLGDDDQALAAHPRLAVMLVFELPLLDRLRLSPKLCSLDAGCVLRGMRT